MRWQPETTVSAAWGLHCCPRPSVVMPNMLAKANSQCPLLSDRPQKLLQLFGVAVISELVRLRGCGWALPEMPGLCWGQQVLRNLPPTLRPPQLSLLLGLGDCMFMIIPEWQLFEIYSSPPPPYASCPRLLLLEHKVSRGWCFPSGLGGWYVLVEVYPTIYICTCISTRLERLGPGKNRFLKILFEVVFLRLNCLKWQLFIWKSDCRLESSHVHIVL